MSQTVVSPVEILLVDDHAIVREGIRACLSAHPHLQVVGEAADGWEALRQFRLLSPDLVLMDISLPQLGGLETTRLLVEEFPQAKVLILTVHKNKEYASQAVRAGAIGYVLKDTSPAELIQAVESLLAGQPFFSPFISGAVIADLVGQHHHNSEPDPLDQLTEREREILKLVAEGLSNKEAARRLGLSVRTVQTHRDRLMRKLDIHNAVALTRFAITRGLLSLNSLELPRSP